MDPESDTESDSTAEAESTEPGPTASGLEPNVAGALSYLLGPITGILFYLLEPDDEFVRFHAAQSTILFGGLFVLSIVLSILFSILALIPILGWIFGALLGVMSLVVSLLAFLAWIVLMYKAYSGAKTEVPLVAPHAYRYAAK